MSGGDRETAVQIAASAIGASRACSWRRCTTSRSSCPRPARRVRAEPRGARARGRADRRLVRGADRLGDRRGAGPRHDPAQDGRSARGSCSTARATPRPGKELRRWPRPRQSTTRRSRRYTIWSTPTGARVGPVLGRFFAELRERQICRHPHARRARARAAAGVRPGHRRGARARSSSPSGRAAPSTSWTWVAQAAREAAAPAPVRVRADPARRRRHAAAARGRRGRRVAHAHGHARARRAGATRRRASIRDIACFEPEA